MSAGVVVGGDHFTSDVAVGLHTPLPEAEKIKKMFGSVLADWSHEGTSIEVPSLGDRPSRFMAHRRLSEILEPRAQELLGLALDELRRHDLDRQLGAGRGSFRRRSAPERNVRSGRAGLRLPGASRAAAEDRGPARVVGSTGLHHARRVAALRAEGPETARGSEPKLGRPSEKPARGKKLGKALCRFTSAGKPGECPIRNKTIRRQK